MLSITNHSLIAVFVAMLTMRAAAADAVFFRAVNLNGPTLAIDGRAWEAESTKDFSVTGKTFANQGVALRPATDTTRAQMIRSSRWGNKVDATFSNVPPGSYQVFLYVWEDNQNEKFNLLVNDAVVMENFNSGTTGMWKRLGPWKCVSVEGKIKISARTGADYGAANLSGIEVWSGDGTVPDIVRAKFADSPTSEQIAFFENKIRPLLADRCYECHSAKAAKIKGGMVLDSRAGVVKGGDTGPAITPGDADASLLIQAVRHTNEDLAMPPKKKLPPEQIAALEEWVRMGAPDPRTDDTVAAVQAKYAIDWNTAREWWSFKPLAKAVPPAVKETMWPANDVDRFILARIESAGAQPAPDAEPRVLIRRLTYDLTGLPPTPEEIEAFVKETEATKETPESIKPYKKLVDRLLASPAYGEAWGRHWLDVVRYADTAGDNSDFPIPQIARYRDWVIAAFNRDLPYDQFVREQLAGDLLPNRTHDQIVATGYIANSRRFGSRVDDYPQHLTIEDTIDNLGRTFLGLTVNCARCHDHKFDPITQQDYYALYGIFHSTRYPWPGIELDQKQRDFVPLATAAEIEAANKAASGHDKEAQRLQAELNRLREDRKNKPDGGEERKKLEADILAAKAAIQAQSTKKQSFELAYAVAEAKKIEDTAVQMKGDPAKPGAVVPRHFLTAFGGKALPADDKSSGRGRLAEWILNESQPLAARVIVNRIWANHFGRGLVPTPNDFGKQGKPCSHPELLDWLAARFISQGWSIKKLHREILMSRAYRQASTQRSADAKSPDLFTPFSRRRLDAESTRDTLLALGGTLDRTPGGTHPFPPQSEWKFTQHNPFKAVYETNKRSVYLMTQRIQRHPYLAIFDGADPSASTPARLTSTTPLQALFLLNDPLVHEQAKRFAARIVAEASDDKARLQRAYLLALARGPSSDELDAGMSFLGAARSKASGNQETEAWNAMARVIFRLNEFVTLD